MKKIAGLMMFFSLMIFLTGSAFATTYIIGVRWANYNEEEMYDPGNTDQANFYYKSQQATSVGQFTKIMVVGKNNEPLFDGWTEATGQKTVNLNEDPPMLMTVLNNNGLCKAVLPTKAEFDAWVKQMNYPPSETVGILVSLIKNPQPIKVVLPKIGKGGIVPKLPPSKYKQM